MPYCSLYGTSNIGNIRRNCIIAKVGCKCPAPLVNHRYRNGSNRPINYKISQESSDYARCKLEDRKGYYTVNTNDMDTSPILKYCVIRVEYNTRG